MAQESDPKFEPARTILGSLWVRVPLAIAIGAGAAAITVWQFGYLNPDPVPLAETQTPPPLPYACPIAGDCKLPGDDKRGTDTPHSETSSTGSDRIMPDSKP
ncbi:MAG: hypothetical protein BGP04_25805 [Rhizobiales bacterium 62-17]|nr:hypothetical protein [Hyphomicrobiales bacterium]OJY00908.1 MAG: hypothetical protein BGP04_25805 [Rhizobiales bacterium 62-17]